VQKIRYPDVDEIRDPTPNLPAAVVKEISAIITKAVVDLRNRPLMVESGYIERIGDSVVEIFQLLTKGRLEEGYRDVDAFQEALHRDAEMAADCMHWAYKAAWRGRMLYVNWHQGLERRLSAETEAIVTKWWERRAYDNPVGPSTPPKIPTRAPRTSNAARIEAFIEQVEKTMGFTITKKDIWLVAGYHSDTEFRLFQGEKDGLTPGIASKFNKAISKAPELFIKERDLKREEHAAYLKKKTQR
jgi:hypothetical protein